MIVSAGVVGVLILVIAIVIAIAISPALKVAPYVYAASRARAARSRMVPLKVLYDLTSNGYTAAIYELEKHGHKELLDVMDDGFREDKVQKMLRARFNKEVSTLARSVAGGARTFLRTLNMRHDVENIVAILRSKSNEHADQHMGSELLLKTHLFESGDLQTLSLDAVISRIKNTPFGDCIDVDQVKQGKVQSTEHKLYKQYFSTLKQQAPNPTCKKFVTHEIDVHNIKQALCFGESKFVTGGSISTRKLKVENLEELKRALKGTSFAISASSVPAAIREVERSHKQFGKSLGMQDPLGMGQVLSYYIAKGIELRNIRILLKLLTVRFSSQEIQTYLV